MFNNRNWSGKLGLVYLPVEYYIAIKKDGHKDNPAMAKNAPNSFREK